MAGKSTYLIANIIDYFLRKGTFSQPASNLYLALCTVMPPNSATGALTGYEVANSGAYARQTMALGTIATTTFFSNTAGANTGASTAGTTGSPGSSFNTLAVQFPAPTANWGTVVGFAIVDSGTWGSGNMWYSGSLGAPVLVYAGGPGPFFGAGSLTIQEG